MFPPTPHFDFKFGSTKRSEPFPRQTGAMALAFDEYGRPFNILRERGRKPDFAASMRRRRISQPAKRWLGSNGPPWDRKAWIRCFRTHHNVLAGALLEQAERLLERGIHPIRIAEGYEVASRIAFEHLEHISHKFVFGSTNIEPLIQTCMTTLSSEIVNRCKCNLSEIALKAVVETYFQSPQPDREVYIYPTEYEVEKGSAFALVLIAIKIIAENCRKLRENFLLLESSCSESQREAALLIGQFAATDSDCKLHIVQRGALQPLLVMLDSPDN
ncbi:hypothetical protein CASFOL_009647 [Castilleja foliolosa]|uniref:Uncharacterized protein n=1 Tax=Castilleja foliolosa TaxID=1961234 RepID=A0ABD3DS57_9LAMI